MIQFARPENTIDQVNLDGDAHSNKPMRGPTMKFRFGNGDKPLDGFTIKRGVGVGGFGEVYFALNDAGKEVALKQIQRNLEVEVRGVRQCMNLKHPNLISLFDVRFDKENQGWIVMEYVSGASLRDALESHPRGLPAEELKRWFGQIAAGVAYLHDHGIVHRDLKPANIFEDEGIVKIGDYGLSKFISCSRRGGQTESVGTFHYMAPEIGKGEYGKEIDIYAMGIMLFEMATGVVPFDGESSQEIIMKHLTSDPDLSLVSPALRDVISIALAKNPAARFRDVRDMVRPLGMEVDDRYLLVRTRLDNNPPVVAHPAPGVNDRPLRSPFAATVQAPEFPNLGTPHATRRASVPPQVEPPEVAQVNYQEPVARALNAGWTGVNRWWADLNLKSGAKTAILVIAIVLAALNTEVILAVLVMALMMYVPYYCLWWLIAKPDTKSTTQPRIQGLAVQAPVYSLDAAHFPKPIPNEPRPRPVAANRPLSVRQWKVAKRASLARVDRGSVWSEVTGSWLGASAVIAVFAAMVVLFQLGSGKPAQPFIIGMVWSALVAMATAWVCIGLGKRWQAEEGDWAIRSFVQLTSGFAIGALAYVIAQFLMVPWETIAAEGSRELPAQRWAGFFDAKQTPLLPAYLAYFPLVMGSIQWWKQVDPLRRTRFSFWAVLWSVIVASLIHLLIGFPQPWAALIVAGASIAIQLSSPWINPAERLRMDRNMRAVA